jgi:ABC-2 type transport system permease protein
VHRLDVGMAMAGAYLRGQMQYRANFLVDVVMGMVYHLTGLLFVGVLLSRFEELAGWTLGEMVFLYGLRLLVHALRGVVFGNVGRVESLIRRGEFDRILIRPIPPLLHLMAMRVPISDIGNLISGLGVFAFALTLVDVDWSPLAVAYLVMAILGGCLIEAAVQLATSAMAFRTGSAQALYVLLNDVVNTYGNYPLSAFPALTRFALTFGLPLAFVAYFPAAVLLGRTPELSVHPAVAYAAPLVGVVWFMLALLLWRSEIGQYRSAGH